MDTLSTVRRGCCVLLAGLGVTILVPSRPLAGAEPDAKRPRAADSPRGRGEELFLRQWVPGDRRSHGGDGLGPVYNERSCVNCHFQGGPGGAGPADRNIELITPAPSGADNQAFPTFYYAFAFRYGPDGFEYTIGDPRSAQKGFGQNPPRVADLVQIHPGFRATPSVVLHRYGNDPDYRAWRDWVLERHGNIAFRRSQRNPTPLFGVGKIDAIPDAVIEAAARRRPAGWPQVNGRVSRLADGRIGRFGWKAQTATLREFVLSAAAVELGLEVPRHAQAGDPRMPPLLASGLDLNQAECDDLTDFVKSLPEPLAILPASPREARAVKAGKTLFKSIGCAACHTPSLGAANGIYSDLLLHEMSPELSDTGIYGAFLAGAGGAAAGRPAPKPDGQPGDAPRLSEWRTPPLWGLSESAPYLHDGRAATVDEAILLHGGEAAGSAQRYRQLSSRDKKQLMQFLLTLAVPPPADNPALARNGE